MEYKEITKEGFKSIKNLKQLITEFSDEQKCIEFLALKRWGNTPICPYCNSTKSYKIENGKRFKCANNKCYKKYSVTVGTIFHDSKIPLTTWFPAIYLISAHKKGISSCQLARDLGVTQKTAWFMLHRVREALKSKESIFLKNTVEIDEVYVGGKVKNMSNTKRAAFKKTNDSNHANKIMIMGMVERGGDLKLKVSPSIEKKNISTIVYNHVAKEASLMTDGDGSYIPVGKHYSSHQSVNHNVNEYVKDGFIHTNTIEGAFGLMRRSIIGIYHQLSFKHLLRYCDEFQYRYNSKQLQDGERFESLLGTVQSRLSWKELTKEVPVSEIKTEPRIKKIGVSGRKTPVHQILKGDIIATYPSLVDAELATGTRRQNISKVLTGIQKSTGGYDWKYA